MKKIVALLLTGMILFSACGDDSPGLPERERPPRTSEDEGILTSPPETTTPPTTTTPVSTTPPPPPPLEFVSEEAEELFDFILASRHVWERENMLGGTLIDLDFDGTPEFLVFSAVEYSGEWRKGGNNISIFRIHSDGFENIAEIRSYGISGDETPNRSIALHTDDDGKRSWAIPNIISNGEITQWRLGLFDFTDDYISEFVKFSHYYHADDWWESFDFFYNEQELFLTPEEIQEYDIVHQRYLAELAWYENDYDDYIENSEKEFYMGEGLWEEGVFPPGGFAFFPTLPPYSSVSDKYDKLKRLFEYSLIPSAYKLDPNRSWENDSRDWREMDSEQFEKSLHRLITAYFTDDKGYLSDPAIYSIGAMAKPVIYLYPEEVTDIEVRVTFPLGGYFTCTYPDYGNGWSVTAYPDGRVINHADGREYSYLYWEGESPANWDFSSGFVVKGSDTVTFLQEKLEYLGLKPREYNEFIVYWLPLMQNNAYNLITFQTTIYEQNAVLNVSPEPDSILRVFMVYMPLDAPPANPIPEQKLESFERTGFAVIEWGGEVVN